MTKYYIESADKSVTYFKSFDMCNEAENGWDELFKRITDPTGY